MEHTPPSKKPSCNPLFRFARALIVVCLCGALAPQPMCAQQQAAEADRAPSGRESPKVPDQVGVQQVSSDRAIEKRLTNILESTGWFQNIKVTVREGVAFLDGRTATEEYRNWAGKLAGNTQDVVAVVNRMQVAERPLFDFSPAFNELQRLWEKTVQKLPLFGLGVLVLFLAAILAKLAAHGAKKILERRLKPLLRDVTARAISIPILILGVYLTLQIVGLTRLAATVLGGTGLAGLIAGIAFRDILENFLASILISIRNPFKIGDVVEIAGHLGVIQGVTTRSTQLINLDGNHVQIPNGLVYKSIIRNYSANPYRRDTFEVGIGYDDDIEFAQETAMNVLTEHPAVLKDPAPRVLVDRLGPATVNLKIYFWYDGSEYDFQKVKSSLIRLVKRAFEKRSISMPDEAREVIFPDGVTVRMAKEEAAGKPEAPPVSEPEKISEPEVVATKAEGDLASEEDQLEEQARRARNPEEGADLLTNEKQKQ